MVIYISRFSHTTVLRSVLLYWLIIASGLSHATDSFYASAQRITAREGLPQSTIFSIARDNSGFLWFGTPTSLIRFDGFEFREFSHEAPGDRRLAVSGAGNIFIDRRGRLWIGTWGEGLVVYDKHMNLLHHFIHESNVLGSLGSDKVQVIFEDEQDNIWIGTNGGGLSLYQPQDNSFINYAHDIKDKTSISNDRVWGITQTSRNVLWIATSDGLNRLDFNDNKPAQAQFTRFKPDIDKPNTLNHSLIRDVYADRSGRLWVGTQIDFGLFEPKTGVFNKVDLKGNNNTQVVTRIKQDNSGNILIATLQGLYHYQVNKGQLTDWAGNNKYQLFPQNDIRDIMVDNSGILWVTTRFAGLIKIDLTPSTFKSIATFERNSTQQNMAKIYAILSDNIGTLWLGSIMGLLYKTSDSTVFKRFELPEKLNTSSISAIAQDQSGFIWLGGRFGLYTLNITSKEVIDRNDILASIALKNVQSLLVDSRNDLWVGTAHEGLIQFNLRGQLRAFRHDTKQKDSLSGNTILSIFEDDAKQIWVGTSGAGINRLDLNHERFYQYHHDMNQSNSVSDNTINDIYQTEDGVMWFATPKSLDKLDYASGDFVHYGASEGLLNSNITSLIEDDYDDLWVSTNKGIYQFKQQAQSFHNYSTTQETGSNDYLPGVVAKNQFGDLIFGGTNGITQVVPSKIDIDDKPPQTVITNVWIDNQRIESYDFSANQPLVLSYQTRSLEIEFSALDFYQPLENKYNYILEGFDDSWRGAKRNRRVSYTNLKPGDYQFKVKGSNSHNQWSTSAASLIVQVTAPWWQLWWVRVLITTTLLLVLYLFSVLRVARITTKKEELELQVLLRTNELDLSNKALAKTVDRLNESQNELVEKAKMASLGQMVGGIAHEVNTPIGLGVTASTLLQQQIEEIKAAFDAKLLKPAQLDKFLNQGLQSTGIIFRNLERAAKLINSFKQVSVDQSSDQDRLFNVAQILDETRLSLSPKLHQQPHQLIIDCPTDIEIYSRPGPFTQIVINLVMNSLIHAFTEDHKGVMELNIAVDSQALTMVYTDNGIGVDRHFQKVIFDPFVTTKRGAGSSGLGMHLVYNLVNQALNGTISLESESGQGVKFTIVFPRDIRVK